MIAHNPRIVVCPLKYVAENNGGIDSIQLKDPVGVVDGFSRRGASAPGTLSVGQGEKRVTIVIPYGARRRNTNG
jgi:hypothetical protein